VHAADLPLHGSVLHLTGVPPSQSGAGSFTPSPMHVQGLLQLSACVLQSVAVAH
jgi:hypothetical protein